MNYTTYTTLIVTIGLCLAINVSAQEDLPDREVQVMKDFRARLADEVKTPDLPLPVSRQDTSRSYLQDYQLSMPRLELQDAPSSIKVSKVEEHYVRRSSYPGYFDLHYGINHRRRLHAGYSYLVNDDATIDARIRYDGYDANDPSWLEADDLDASLGTSFVWSDWLLEAEGSYAYRDQGINASTLESLIPFSKSKYTAPTIRLGARRQLDQLWNIHLDADYSYSHERYELTDPNLSEAFRNQMHSNNHEVGVELEKADLLDQWVFGLQMRYQHTNWNPEFSDAFFHPDGKLDNYFAGLWATYNADKWSVEIESAVLLSDEDEDWLPTLTAHYAMSNTTHLSAGLRSSHQYMSIGRIHRINPFVHLPYMAGTPIVERRYFIEGHTELAGTHIGLNVSYADVERRVFFQALLPERMELPIHNTFIPILSDAKRLQVSLDARRPLTDQIEVKLSASYDQIYPDLLEDSDGFDQNNWLTDVRGIYKDAWLPGLDLSLRLELIHGQFAGVYNLPDRVDAETYITMHARADYAIGRQLTAYLELYNLFDDQTPQYPSMNRLGFSPTIGVSGRF